MYYKDIERRNFKEIVAAGSLGDSRCGASGSDPSVRDRC